MARPVVLIVDDEPANLAVFSRWLGTEYQVRVSKSGQQALELARKDPQPDLILLDVMMPEMDGYAVIAELKAKPQTAEIPVIFVTALDQSFDEETGLSHGAVDYITKPVRPAIMMARVKAHIEIKHARDHLRRENQWLEEEVARRTEEALLIQNMSLGVILGLAETRDTDTGHHIMRTQLYVETLARELSTRSGYAGILQEQIVSRMVKASPLHDIGKIGIPDSVLLKPGKLSDAEWVLMRSHTSLGAEAIQNAIDTALTTNSIHEGARPEALLVLEMARDIALTHHEKWDGTGYPHGLSEEGIPLCGRIMALADVFDALVTPRVYKRAWSTQEAVELILSQAGLQFDPAVVSAFEAQLSAFESIHSRLGDPVPDEMEG